MNGIQLTDFTPTIHVRRDEQGMITSGLQVGDTLQQNQALILALNKGELKERPSVGCGIADMLMDHDPLYWRTLIREQLEMDRQRVNNIRITPKGIEIDATY
ncbi:MAG: hypothetical protein HXO19_02215 [Prevotella shahii]|uniref:hypothetical protein n=1 Tax=Hoylesella shahii TaxID=228603 RepID=UPI001CADE482|nr:hypothetical protein [Hoylesella shahii]MBF1589929.1 hypothetical protein [Hoylesella shahii]